MRLIDADALKEWFRGGIVHLWTDDIINRINHTPTIDAVPVVRCKDCKHYHADTLTCQNDGCGAEHPNWYGNDFCSYGERRDSNNHA